jgi:hypothetical protein
MNGLIRKLVRVVGVRWLTGQIRAAAEGKLGPKWQGLYWWLAGRKRTISTFIAVAAAVVGGMGYVTAAEILAATAVVGMSLGFVDSNWRSEEYDDWLKDSAIWKLLANNSPMITTLALAGLGWLQGTTCTLGEWCSYLSIALTITMAVFVQIGIVDAAWNAPAPKV